MRSFGNRTTYRDYASDERSRRLIRTTRTSRTYEYQDSKIVNRGVDPKYIEQRTQRRFDQALVGERQDGQGERLVQRGAAEGTNRIEVYRAKEHEAQSAPEHFEIKSGGRRSSLEKKNIEQSAPPKIERTPRTQTPTNRSGRGTRIQKTEPSQAAPEVTPPKGEKPTIERRRDLMERYDRSNPTPPARESSKVRREPTARTGSSSSLQHSGKAQSERRRD